MRLHASSTTTSHRLPPRDLPSADPQRERVDFGELAALRLDDLDELRRTLRVDEQWSRQGSSTMVPGPLKSKKAYRTIRIPAFLVEELAAHLARFPSRSDFIFSHDAGGPLDYTRFRRRY